MAKQWSEVNLNGRTKPQDSKISTRKLHGRAETRVLSIFLEIMAKYAILGYMSVQVTSKGETYDVYVCSFFQESG